MFNEIFNVMKCFPKSYITQFGELILSDKGNVYFIAKDCNTQKDIICKLLEWCSRPLEYANQRPKSATWTVTGSAAFVLGKERGMAKITGITTGKIVDFGIKDSMNMGAAMAPAAKEVIRQHFEDFGRSEKEYDRIITGDLGTVGQKILIDLLLKDGYDISKIHSDCGIEIFDAESQNTGAGGSGCGCSAVTLSAYFLKQIEDGTLKRILFVPTGALLSTVSFNEGMTVPGIAHAVVIEHADA